MERMEVTQVLEQIRIDIEALPEGSVRQSFIVLLNLVERLASENSKFQEENERLKEEIRRLQGNVKPRGGSQKPASDISSEEERKKRELRERPRSSRHMDRRVFKDIPIHEEKVCPVDPEELPADAQFTGYIEVPVQDVRIELHNTKFLVESWYSPSQGRHIHGQLPQGYEGEFGPHLKSLVVTLKYIAGTSQPRILEFLEAVGVLISPAAISNIFLDTAEPFHEEKSDVFRAGLESTSYQQIDDTSARVNGESWHTHIVCNPWYTAYFTTPRKDRLTVLDVLRGFAPRAYRFNAETRRLLEHWDVPQKLMARLSEVEGDREYTQEEMDRLLGEWFPDPAKGSSQRTHVLEAAAIAAYHQQDEIPVPILICDDAEQFKWLTEFLGLCWIHQGRHYKRLSPVVPRHQELLSQFVGRFWDYYRQLQAYRQHPTPAKAKRLSAEFDRLFSTRTGYEDLDERISKTAAKKGELLTVLAHPEVPLHNNESELGARVSARRRDVSLQTKNARGTQAMDTFTTIAQTAKKLGVKAYAYFYDRISREFRVPSLAGLIRARAQPPPHDRAIPQFSDPTHPVSGPRRTVDVAFRTC